MRLYRRIRRFLWRKEPKICYKEVLSVNHEAKIVDALMPYLLAFPQSKITAEGLVIYAKALSVLSIAEINAAMLKLMRTCKFFPSVAEIFEQAEVMREFAANTEALSPDEAWEEVQRQVRQKHLMGGEWEYSCPEVKTAVERFGKYELCTLKIDDVNTARAQFMRIYKSVVDRAKDKRINGEVLAALPKRQVKELIGSLAAKLSYPASA